jgi:hypothetical protein
MTHTTKVIDAKQINNENVVYTVQCCSDPMEVTNHTINVAAPDHAGQLAAIKADVAARHDLMVQARAALPALLAAG